MKFRELMTSSKSKVLCGKDAESNEELVKQFIGKENKIFHTEKPGSPFCVIEALEPKKKEMKEVAVACASRSQDWRDNKQDVVVHAFSGKDVYKKKGMKTGMFGVKSFEEINAKKREIERVVKNADKT